MRPSTRRAPRRRRLPAGSGAAPEPLATFLTLLPSGRVTGGAAGPGANVTGTQVSLQGKGSPQSGPSVHVPRKCVPGGAGRLAPSLSGVHLASGI